MLDKSHKIEEWDKSYTETAKNTPSWALWILGIALIVTPILVFLL